MLHLCERFGHFAKNCFDKHKTSSREFKGAALVEGKKNSNRETERSKKQDSQENHVGSLCILSDKLNDCCVQDNQVVLRCGHILPVIGGACQVCHNMPVSNGYVGSNAVQVLRDSGCSGVVVKRSLVSPDQYTGKSMKCVLIDSTVRTVPEALISVNTPYL